MARSKAKKGKERKKADKSDAAVETEDPEPESSAEQVPLKKQKKSGKTSSRGGGKKARERGGQGQGAKKAKVVKKKKKLEVFNAMPIDILCEILEHLDPKTLLAVSRTGSVFRRILHSDGGKSIWKLARRNVGLADLQRPDVEEWELAQLLFDGTCVLCRQPKAEEFDCRLLVRACKPCRLFKLLVTKEAALERQSNQRKYHEAAFDLVPSIILSLYDETKSVSKLALARVSHQLENLEHDPAALSAFVRSRENIQKQAETDAAMIREWLGKAKERQQDEKQSQKKAIEVKRSVRIQKHVLGTNLVSSLRIEGYEHYELESNDLLNHPDVNNARELFENVWKRIKPILMNILDQERLPSYALEAIGRQTDRASALKSFYLQLESSLPPPNPRGLDLHTFFPPFANFLDLPSVKLLYLPEGTVPSTNTLLNAKSAILQDIQAFASNLDKAFSLTLSRARDNLDPDLLSDSLSSSSVVNAVKCPSGFPCCAYSTFPAILDHARLCGGDNLFFSGISFTTSAIQMQIIRQIVDEVKSSGHGLYEANSITDLYALGWSFECETCESKTASGNSFGRGLGLEHSPRTGSIGPQS
ncbi:hypothetical protein JCM16303_004556 [Sporobolomyces ruberrimus]